LLFALAFGIKRSSFFGKTAARAENYASGPSVTDSAMRQGNG